MENSLWLACMLCTGYSGIYWSRRTRRLWWTGRRREAPLSSQHIPKHRSRTRRSPFRNMSELISRKCKTCHSYVRTTNKPLSWSPERDTATRTVNIKCPWSPLPTLPEATSCSLNSRAAWGSGVQGRRWWWLRSKYRSSWCRRGCRCRCNKSRCLEEI